VVKDHKEIEVIQVEVETQHRVEAEIQVRQLKVEVETQVRPLKVQKDL
jgi:hypothetical protein